MAVGAIHIRHLAIALCFLALGCRNVVAQEFTESGTVLGDGNAELELGFVFERISENATTASAPSLLLRIGISDNAEVIFVTPNIIRQSHLKTDTGFGDAVIGGKLDLGTLGSLEYATMALLSVPIGASKFTSSGWDPSLFVVAETSISERVSVAGQGFAASVTTGDRRQVLVGNSVALLATLDRGERLQAFMEVDTSVLGSEPTSVVIHHGYKYAITENAQIDLRAGLGLTRNASDSFFGGGIILSR